MPEWYFLLIFIGALTTLAASWRPLLWLSPFVVVGVLATFIQAGRGGYRARFHDQARSRLGQFAMHALVASFHVLQPAARLLGRVQHGLGPWSWKSFAWVLPVPKVISIWSDRWVAVGSRLSQLHASLKELGATTSLGGDFDEWDFSIHGGLFGTVRVIAMVEEHGNGQQLFRLRAWPKPPVAALAVLLMLLTLATLAGLDQAWLASALLGLSAITIGFLIYADCAISMSYWRNAVDHYLQRHRDLQIVA
jgi:hypothetical protein